MYSKPHHIIKLKSKNKQLKETLNISQSWFVKLKLKTHKYS